MLCVFHSISTTQQPILNLRESFIIEQLRLNGSNTFENGFLQWPCLVQRVNIGALGAIWSSKLCDQVNSDSVMQFRNIAEILQPEFIESIIRQGMLVELGHYESKLLLSSHFIDETLFFTFTSNQNILHIRIQQISKKTLPNINDSTYIFNLIPCFFHIWLIQIVQLFNFNSLFIQSHSTTMKPQSGPSSSLKDKRKAFQSQLKQGQTIAGKYEVLQQVGQGVSSVVIKARNIKTNEIVAIKKIKSFLTNIHQSTRVLRQIILLRHLKHPNIIQLKQVIVEEKQGVTLYLVLQYEEKDVKKIFFSNKILTLQEIKRVVFQILLGLKYCHQCQVLHRDLKPENILTNIELTEIKLCDFGLARTVILEQLQSEYGRIKSELSALGVKRETNVKQLKPSNLSIHVATRWYRAPELILLQKKYNSAIDIWSVGCILGELLCMMKENSQTVENRRPLFPGKACYPLSPPKTPDMNYQRINDFPHSVYDQLSMIFQVIGTPDDISYITDERAKHYLKSFGKIEKTPFKEIFKYLPVQIEDFLEKALKFNPNQRMSVVEAINHRLFDDIRPNYKNFQEIIGKPFYFELNDLTKQQIYKLVLQEQEYYQSQQRQGKEKMSQQSEMVPE